MYIIRQQPCDVKDVDIFFPPSSFLLDFLLQNRLHDI